MGEASLAGGWGADLLRYMRASIADLADACKLSRGALYHRPLWVSG